MKPSVHNVILRSLVAVLVACSNLGGDRHGRAADDERFAAVVHETAAMYESSPAITLRHVSTICDGMRDSACAFRDIRVALVASDTSVFLGDGWTELWQFNPDGVPIRRVGRAGQGPGELLSAMAAGIDSSGGIVIYDVRQFRLTHFDSSGAFVASRRLRPEPTFAAIRLAMALPVTLEIPGADSIGSWVAASFVAHPTGDSMVRPVLAHVRARARTHPGSDLVSLTPPFTPVPSWDVGAGGRIAYATGDAFEIELHDGTGAPPRLIRSEVPPERIPPSVRDSIKDALLAPGGRPSQSAEYRAQAAVLGKHTPEHYPVLTEIRILADGNIWVRGFPLQTRTVRWHLFDPDGNRIGHADIAATTMIADGWLRRILLVTHDSLGTASAGWYDVEVGVQ